MVCCSLRCSQPPRGPGHAGGEAPMLLTPAGEGTSDTGRPAQQGTGVQRSSQSRTQPPGWAQKELQKKSQAMGNTGLGSHAHWPCTKCSCSVSALTERMLLASALLVPAVTLHLAERARKDSCPQKLHKQVQQSGLRQSFLRYFKDPCFQRPFLPLPALPL